jgi:RNA polymerase subunit RPABC4/transcription elongation factor Spt4
MQEILDTIGGAIGSVFDNPVIKLGFQIVAIYWVVLWLAAAYWAFRDMQLRTENPVAPYFAAAFVIVFTPLLFPLAIFAYRIVRPQERIGEIYERNLAEEAMLAEIETIRHCPSCDRRVHADWIICPTCRTRLNRVCPNCARLVGLDWSLCAWCGRDFERADAITSPVPVPTVTAPVREALPPGEPVQAARTARPPGGRPAAAAPRPIDSLTES